MGDDLPRRGPTGPAGALSIQVLVDADNVTGPRLNALLAALRDVPARIVAAGSRESLRAVSWPGGALLFPREGWQRADVALADAYTPTPGPLVIVSGDGARREGTLVGRAGRAVSGFFVNRETGPPGS